MIPVKWTMMVIKDKASEAWEAGWAEIPVKYLKCFSEAEEWEEWEAWEVWEEEEAETKNFNLDSDDLLHVYNIDELDKNS